MTPPLLLFEALGSLMAVDAADVAAACPSGGCFASLDCLRGDLRRPDAFIIESSD